MAWKSREDKAPPPQFFADVIGFLRKAFPGATLSREAIAELAPHLVAEWQKGQSARNAAKATCACDGKRITVSPAAEVTLPRRSVLPPPGATRGTPFGIDELRERREIGKLRAQAAVEDRHAEYHAERLRQLQLGASNGARSAKTEHQTREAQAAIQTHRARAAQLRQQAEQIAAERGFWIPPTAESRAREEAAKKQIGPRRKAAPEPAKQESKRKKVAAKATPSVPPGGRSDQKKKCDLCTDAKPQDKDLSALVDEFVDAAMKDGGK